MSGPTARPRRVAPPPGQAPLPAENAAALLRRNAADPDIASRPAVRFEDRVWTHGEYVAESCRWANLFIDRLPAGRPPHVAVLLDNVPEYLFAFGGAALAGAAIVGLNHTRRGEHLLRDLEHTDFAYGATEGGVAVNREVEERAGALGMVRGGVKVVDDDGTEKPRARFDAGGRLANADECVGEIVNTEGVGPFEGYYNNASATEKTTRFGWYWSGDLGYVDEDGYLFFAGRTADWIRVDGENFPAGPIEDVLRRHPGVVLSAVYGVPDASAGDQVMASLVLRDDARFDPAAFAAWIDGLADIGPKWRPRYVRILRNPPTTGTNKIVKRTLVHQKWRHDRVDGDAVFVRSRGDDAYRELTVAEEQELEASFASAGRPRFWDL